MDATNNITVSGSVFRCPVGWTATNAEDRIRGAFNLTGGYIARNGIALAATEVIGDAEGLVFVGGTPTQGKPTHTLFIHPSTFSHVPPILMFLIVLFFSDVDVSVYLTCNIFIHLISILHCCLFIIY